MKVTPKKLLLIKTQEIPWVVARGILDEINERAKRCKKHDFEYSSIQSLDDDYQEIEKIREMLNPNEEVIMVAQQ